MRFFKSIGELYTVIFTYFLVLFYCFTFLFSMKASAGIEYFTLGSIALLFYLPTTFGIQNGFILYLQHQVLY